LTDGTGEQRKAIRCTQAVLAPRNPLNRSFCSVATRTPYNPKNRNKRKATWDVEKSPEGRWRKFSHAELTARDKTSLDVFWLKDKSLTDLDNLPEPDELAEEIIENLEAGLNSFRQVLVNLQAKV